MAMQSSMRPRQRPDDLDTTPSTQSDPVALEASGGGGKGGPLEAGKENDAKIQRSLSKKSGWGYYDPNTRERVPWYIDMINGGGMNAAGDTFQGGVGTAALAGGLMNQLGIKPYGADRERAYMPMEAWRGGDYTINPTPLLDGYRPAAPVQTAPSSVNTPSGQEGLLTYGPQNPRNPAPPPLSYGPQNPRRLPEPPLQYGPQNGRGSVAPRDPSLIAAEQLASELGNAWFMMPQSEQVNRINQRVMMMGAK